MWLLDLALRRPISIIVGVTAVILCAALALVSMRIDIFPNLNLPVIYVVQPYGGMDPSQMEGYLVDWYEQHFFYIDGIKSVESRSIPSVAVLKLAFHPGTNMAEAMSNTVGMIERSKAYMPPGTVGPFVLRFDAGSVPIGYLVVESANRTLAELEDLAITRIRPMFSSLPGVSGAPAFGGNQRTVVITIDPQKVRSYQLSADKVVEMLVKSNVIVPNGDVRINGIDRLSRINSVAESIDTLRSTPIKVGAGPTVFLKDIATIGDSSDIPTGYALVKGKHAVYIPVVKLASASTITVVNEVKGALPDFRHGVPPDVSVNYAFDQSPYVTEAIMNVAREGIQGALLTSLMVLLFLGNARSALIVMATIPSAVLGALVLLWTTGQTINIMTLGGLALAIGILVDQSTVTIENIHTHISEGQPVATAVYYAGKETIGPNFLAMLAVISVFVPALFMKGMTKALFVPLSLAVGFALAVSFVLSATLVPILSVWFLSKQKRKANANRLQRASRVTVLRMKRLWRRLAWTLHRPKHKVSAQKESGLFAVLKQQYTNWIHTLLARPRLVTAIYVLASIITVVIIAPVLRQEVFPSVQNGQFAMLIKAPSGLRFEKTAVVANKILDIIARESGGKQNVEFSIGYVGTQPPAYALNNLYMFTSGPNEALLTVEMKPDMAISITALEEKLRKAIPAELPGTSVVFEPGDIISKIMNVGASTPVEVAVTGLDLAKDSEYANKLLKQLAYYPKFRDLHIGQTLNYPNVEVKVDRELAGQLGVTMQQVGHAMVEATSSSRWIAPNYWRDPTTGVSYQVQIEYPQWHIGSLEDLGSIPAMPEGKGGPYVHDVAKLSYGSEPGEIDHYNQQRLLSIGANVIDSDLGRASKAVQWAIARVGPPPQGVFVHTRGQIPVMNETFFGLGIGLLLAAIVILLMLTANFESLALASVVICAVPGVIAGVMVALLVTGTSLNIESFMGAIMAVGVGVANAILLVTFANHFWQSGKNASAAAADAGIERLRPILMTSISMVVGMIPMAVSAEAQSNLARAVIGGLLLSTPTVLFILPPIFALICAKREPSTPSLHPLDENHATN